MTKELVRCNICENETRNHIDILNGYICETCERNIVDVSCEDKKYECYNILLKDLWKNFLISYEEGH